MGRVVNFYNNLIKILIAPVQHAACHVLPMSWVAFHHLISRFEAGIGDFGHRQLLMECLFSRNNGCVGGQWEMNTRIRHQIGLELS